jgi:myo-inositol 2-dehydrogenase/D-chiro-inositol 1-dehydrogenase
VLIAAPTDRHLELVQQVVAAGLPVLCEKPCGLTVEQTRACAGAAAEAGQFLQVAYWRRYVPELQQLRSDIAAGALGELLAVHCSQWDQSPPPASFRDSSGGIFVDMGVHEFDQLRWLTGQEVSAIQSVTSRLAPAGDPADPDCGQAIGALAGGATAMVTVGRWHPAGDTCRVEVYGTAGTRQCTFLRPDNAGHVLEQAFAAQLAGFARGVRTGVGGGASVADAVAALGLAAIATERAG